MRLNGEKLGSVGLFRRFPPSPSEFRAHRQGVVRDTFCIKYFFHPGLSLRILSQDEIKKVETLVNRKISHAASVLVDARALFDRALSDNLSLIAMDILLAVASYRPESDGVDADAPTVKWVFAAMPRSRRGVRLQFNRLIENSLLLVEASNGDRRSKRVRLSPSSIQLFEQIALIVGGDEPVHPDAISPSHNGRAAGQALPIADSPRL